MNNINTKILKYSSLDFIKEASLFEDLGFSGIASTIKDTVKNQLVDEDSPSGYLNALGNIILTGALFRVHPVLAFTYGIAEGLGVDVKGILSSIWNMVKAAVSSGAAISENVFDNIAKSACRKEALTKIAKVKIAQSPNIPLIPDRNKSLIQRLFGNLLIGGRRNRASWLAKGIIIWALKNALLGAGILTATGLATGLVKKVTDSDEPETKSIDKELNKEVQTEDPSGSAYVPQGRQSRLRPSGAGTKVFKNDMNNMWIIPLINGNVSDTLLAWTEEIYPQLSGYDDIIERSPSFQRILSLLNSNKSSADPNSLLVPPGFTSRKQVVDLFAHDVAKDLI